MGELPPSGVSPEPEERTAPERFDSWAWLARLRKTQGRKGEIFAEILTDFPQKFAERSQLWLLADGDSGNRSAAIKPAGKREVVLQNHWMHKDGIVLHFKGVDSISAAEPLCGLIVAIPADQREALGEDEVYISDLVGCTLIDVSSAEPTAVGIIQDVDRSAGPVALLVVQSERGEVLVPFAKVFLRTLDTANLRVEMALPKGLLDLNN
ncbi:ribosome maturation factor RimM [Telmatobacter bradus]|uniref:ribosome maturation factor RimM n=1 Tax=Telmatobacter bradus TaxID=474953 RepID=UPI003B42E732